MTYLPFVTLAVMAAIAFWAAQRVTAARVPMQWGWDGKPNWYAPRLVGLWLPVGVGALLLGLTAVLPAEPGEAWVLPFAVAVVFAAQLFYLWLLFRWQRAR
jgi:hypothetical protein